MTKENCGIVLVMKCFVGARALSRLGAVVICASVAAQPHAEFFKNEINAENYSRRKTWLEREQNVFTRCLKPNFSKTKCAYFPNRSPLERFAFVPEAWLRSQMDVESSAAAAAAEVVKSCVVFALAPRNKAYWLEQEINTEYVRLKCLLAKKKMKERLSDCQTACLATCLSSNLMEYDYSPSVIGIDSTPVNNARAAVCSGKGVCREFAAVAVDLLSAAGVKAKRVLGRAYDEKKGTKKTPAGGHAMVGMQISGKEVIFEPQDERCYFYSSKFSPEANPDLDRIEYLE